MSPAPRSLGGELEARKTFGLFPSPPATPSDTRNEESGDRLDLIPAQQLNASVRFYRASLFSLTLWGIAASDSIYHSASGIVTVAPYAVINAALERSLGKFNVYLKVENLLNNEYWTEPGWPNDRWNRKRRCPRGSARTGWPGRKERKRSAAAPG